MNIAIRQKIIQATKNGPTDSAPIVGLHCSGATSRQWSALRSEFESRAPVLLPEFIGTESRGHRTGSGRFSLREEAVEIVREIRALPGPAHLVAHSYGGGVALHIARHHPELVRSLCIYEPTSFHVLNNGKSDDLKLFREIEALSSAMGNAIDEGNITYAAHVFTEFWGGLGAWQALSKTQRTAMRNWVRKGPLDFHALLYEPAGKPALSAINVPTTLIYGTLTHPHTRRIAEELALAIPDCRLCPVQGASHMGPFTHRQEVLQIVGNHLTQVARNGQQAICEGLPGDANSTPSLQKRSRDPRDELADSGFGKTAKRMV